MRHFFKQLIAFVEITVLFDRVPLTAVLTDEEACEDVCAQLLHRVRVLDLEQSSENTMPISPVLICALCLLNEQSGRMNGTKVRLICDKLISGA